MPSQITGLMSVKNGQKQQMLNISNAREIPYSQYSTMSEEQKNGVIICPDYPVGGESGGTLISSDKVSYDNGSTPSLTKGGSKGGEESNSTGITSTNIQDAVTELATPTFDEASTRTNINSGDTFKTILGKIKKFFTDLKTVAFTGSYNDLSDKPTIPVGSDYIAKVGDTMTGQLAIKQSNSTTSHIDSALILGNNIPNGTTGCTYGKLRLWGDGAYRTDLLATVSTANRNIYFPDATGTVALTDDIPDISAYIPKTQPHAQMLARCSGGGNYQWFKVAVLTITAGYINYPIIFEVSSRGRATLSHISIVFASTSSVDPNLARISTDFDQAWYIKKTNTSTWELYCNTGSVWNNAYIHRVFGGLNNGVDVNITVEGLSSAPTGTTSAIPTGSVEYAVQATQDSDGNTISSTYVKKSGDTMSGALTIAGTDNYAEGVRCNTASNGFFSLLLGGTGTSGTRAGAFWIGGNTNNHLGKLFISNNASIDSDISASTYFEALNSNYNILDFHLGGSLTVLSTGTFGYNGIYIQEPASAGGYKAHICSFQSSKTHLTANRTAYLPDKTGTIALTSDISSERFKENITPLSDEDAKKLLDVEVVNFDYKDGITGEDERYNNKGVIAEQVEDLIPYVIEHEKDEETDGDILKVDYRKFIPYLIKTVQMQQNKIDSMQKEINELKEIINEILNH